MVKCKEEAFAFQNSIGLALLPRGNFTKSLSIATFLLGLVSTSILPLLPFPPTWHGNCSTKESSSQKSFFSRCYTKTKWLINKATWPDVGTKRSFLFRFLCDDGKSLEARDSLSEKFATTVLWKHFCRKKAVYLKGHVLISKKRPLPTFDVKM